MEDVTDVDHRNGKRALKSFDNKNLGNCYDLHVQNDTLLLQMYLKILETNLLKHMI